MNTESILGKGSIPTVIRVAEHFVPRENGQYVSGIRSHRDVTFTYTDSLSAAHVFPSMGDAVKAIEARNRWPSVNKATFVLIPVKVVPMVPAVPAIPATVTLAI